jgi:serine/threonine protein kinase
MASEKSRMQKLDSGGQGQIYAVNSSTIYKSIKFSDHYKEISELCVLKALPHPCIVEVKRWELSRNDCKIYMERMYSNIYDYAKKCSFERRLELFPRVLWTMIRVARFFQLNGVINCDIKSENVMISKDGTSVKVIDFGHLICDENYPIIGTRSYQPPELWLRDTYDYRSMVWSIGITALEFLYRVHPIVDMIYGDEDDTPISSPTKSSASGSLSGSGTGSKDYSVEDEFRERYTHLFQILEEEGGVSLPFRHRIEQADKKHRERLASINNLLEKMLMYDPKKRISLEELYHCRLFDNIRQGVKEEKILTHQREFLFLHKELTPYFMSLGRKLYREEVMVQAYTILSMYLDKNPAITRDRQEFTLSTLACLDIMSYVFSMVPSSRDLHRKIILKMKSLTEYQVFDRVIDILKAIEFKVFLRSPVLSIKSQEKSVVFPLLLELIESDAEAGKKKIPIRGLMDRYASDDYSSDKDESSDEEDEEYDEKEEEEEEIEIAEEDDVDFVQEFRKRVQNLYHHDKLRKREEDDTIEIEIL